MWISKCQNILKFRTKGVPLFLLDLCTVAMVDDKPRQCGVGAPSHPPTLPSRSSTPPPSGNLRARLTLTIEFSQEDKWVHGHNMHAVHHQPFLCLQLQLWRLPQAHRRVLDRHRIHGIQPWCDPDFLGNMMFIVHLLRKILTNQGN